ncbi:substrate-binding domain-containing protein [Cryptosporangium phraense]|uniref:Substrate-binding domain-containing protein n=1 Tax=Cryptosporangium phraense TaxID=2593070 RepID=A0A545AQD0_9ACTN|nr:substrate-binding domain-containing protein [Cryptosporangium phraense]
MLGLAACGSATGDSKSDTAEGKPLNSSVPTWCGSKKITLALADGFGGNAWRQVTRAEAQDEVSKCPSVTSYLYADGQGNTQKAISDIQGFTAKGVDAMVVFPDAGKAMLPALRSAYKAGVVTVPYRVSPGGEAGKDYDYFVDTDFKEAGVLWANWLVKALPNGGNVVNLGGPPANSQSQDEYTGMMSVLKDHPNIKFVGQTPYNVTNWDPAETQKVVTALLAKYPKIDAITTDYGNALASSFSAFQQAGRKIPPIATEDANLLGCEFQKAKSAGSGWGLFTVSSQNWMSRLAVDVAVAKATGGVIPTNMTAPQEAFEDSLTGQPNQVKCDPSLPGDAFLSSKLTPTQQQAALKG